MNKHLYPTHLLLISFLPSNKKNVKEKKGKKEKRKKKGKTR